MDKGSKLIGRFAAIGFVVAALVFLSLKLSGEFDANLYMAFAIFCPPALLCVPFSEVMKDKSGFYGVWSMIVITNSGLYAVIGAAVVGLRKRPKAKSD